MAQSIQFTSFSEKLVSPQQDLLSITQEDWSFAHLTFAHTMWGPHGYHRYPAKFIPQLVRRIIERYSLPGEYVGDPFLGSATTGIEALRTGRYFYGSDIHPVALLISKAKCTPIRPPDLLREWKALEDQLLLIPRIGKRPLLEKEKAFITSIKIAQATPEERFFYWFPSAHQKSLQVILKCIQEVPEEKMRIFFLCAFSNILRSCSIWLSGSTKPQKDLTKVLADPVEEFCKQVQNMIKRNTLYWEDLRQEGRHPETISQRMNLAIEDARHLSLPNGVLDLLVTSPPYATCYEYSEMHQLTQLWFEKYGVSSSCHPAYSYIGGSKGLAYRGKQQGQQDCSTGSKVADVALTQLQCHAVGSLASDISQEVRALRWYFRDMYDALHQFARVIAVHKHLALIIGDSYRRGISIPTTDALCEMAISVGFEPVQRIVRRVPGRVLVSTRDKKTGRFSSTAQSDTQVYPEESVLIFRQCR